MQTHANKNVIPEEESNDFNNVISTGSTLLDLAISGGCVRGGGIPGGKVVEIFGPSGCGKTVLLCEIARRIQQKGGAVRFSDPEARLNEAFASVIGLNINDIDYDRPDTVRKVFEGIREWKPETKDGVDEKTVIHGVIADSLAALSTEMEMEEEDKMGMRRAKDFSEQLRKTCRLVANKNYLMVCSNQVRQNLDAGPYGQKWTTPGGQAFPFYSSLRLRCMSPEKVKRKRTIAGKEQARVIGVETLVEVAKSSIWESFRTAPIYIEFSYGVDDIRPNLEFVKHNTGNKVYMVNDNKLSVSLDESVGIVESERFEKKLRNQVINLWEEIEEKFKIERRVKK